MEDTSSLKNFRLYLVFEKLERKREYEIEKKSKREKKFKIKIKKLFLYTTLDSLH